jgi:hypothetical protein
MASSNKLSVDCEGHVAKSELGAAGVSLRVLEVSAEEWPAYKELSARLVGGGSSADVIFFGG